VTLRRILLCLVFLLLAACTRDEPPTAPAVPPVPAEQLRATWAVRAALDERIDVSLLNAVARRWLSGTGDWSAPGSPPGGASPALAARWISEDAGALKHLAAINAHATCRLGQHPGAFDGPVVSGYSVAVRSCEAIDDTDGAGLARTHAELNGAISPPATPSDGGYSLDVVALTVELESEKLLYEFIEPGEFDAVTARLISAAAALPAPPSGPDPDVGTFFATRAGTSDLLPEGQEPVVASASSLFAALPASGGRQAAAEVALDRELARWAGGLALLPAETDGGLDGSGKALLDGWVRKAWHRELGLLALDAGEADLALYLLEEATDNKTRVKPGAGVDPVLLCALARARYESNELQRAVALLEDIGATPGWESARIAARAVARVAVLPTAAEAQVKR
jgi:hypothetical protein